MIDETPLYEVAGRPRRRNWPAILLFWLVLFGAFLLLQFSERFVFLYAETYIKTALWSTLLLTPFVLHRMNRAPFSVAQIAGKYPSTWLRRWIIMPLAVSAAIGLLFAAPLGWLFAAAAWSTSGIDHVHATALEVGPYARRKGCDQSVTLRFASVDKTTCLDSLNPNSSIRTGQLLDVGISSFPFGFLIVSIVPRHPK